MQNKINQKVPIAKMDELIAAIKESGGSKIYQHNVTYNFNCTIDGTESSNSVDFITLDSSPYAFSTLTDILDDKSLVEVNAYATDESQGSVPMYVISINSSFYMRAILTVNGSLTMASYKIKELGCYDTVTEL